MNWHHPIGIWIGALGTIALFSLIYRENRVYRLVEHLFIGLAGGFLIKQTWNETLWPQCFEPMSQGAWPWAFAIGLGCFFYTIYSKKYSWMSRVAVGVLLGLVSGQIFQQTANEFIPQIQKSFKPLWVSTSQLPPGSGVTQLGMSLSNLFFVAIVVCVLTYFLFSFEQKGPIKKAANGGRYMLMFAFGAIFGSTVMARMALLIDRVWFLMHDWLGIG